MNLKARFDLATEFGYAESEKGSVEVEVLARTSNPYYFLIKLPAGYEPAEFIHDGVIACASDFLHIYGEPLFLPMWTEEQKALFANIVEE